MDARLLCGDCRDLLPSLEAASVDACITDPPYGDTDLAWDTQVDGWLEQVARVLKPNGSVWVFGSLRFLAPLFVRMKALGFKYSQDVVWEKQNGSGLHADRFRRVHEHAVLWYRGAWRDVYHDPQYTFDAVARKVRRKTKPAHWHGISEGVFEVADGGPRLMRSVIYAKNAHRHALHPTQKPVDLCALLVRYSCPPGGLVLDPFMGSASVGAACDTAQRRYIGIERDPHYYDVALKRLGHP